MEIMLATGNAHKRDEIAAILNPHTVLIPGDKGLAPVWEENGVTYQENALIKARALAALTPLPVLADDSGLSVPALGGEPGIYSARYGSKPGESPLESPQRNAFLLEKMASLSGRDREASFVCCMVLYLGDLRFFCAQETLDGRIAAAPSGGGGFGYDPLFIFSPQGSTIAQIPPEEKNKLSHRGRAGRRIKIILDDLEHQP